MSSTSTRTRILEGPATLCVSVPSRLQHLDIRHASGRPAVRGGIRCRTGPDSASTQKYPPPHSAFLFIFVGWGRAAGGDVIDPRRALFGLAGVAAHLAPAACWAGKGG